jgi:hypothetical protein
MKKVISLMELHAKKWANPTQEEKPIPLSDEAKLEELETLRKIMPLVAKRMNAYYKLYKANETIFTRLANYKFLLESQIVPITKPKKRQSRESRAQELLRRIEALPPELRKQLEKGD